MSPTYSRGELVRFNTNSLGVMRDPYGGSKSVIPDVLVNAGDVGSYVEPHPLLGDEGWHIIAVNPLPNVTGYVPAHASMFEPAPAQIPVTGYRMVCPDHGVRATIHSAPAQRIYRCGECDLLLEIHTTVEIERYS